ncbi:hypothetical protein TrVFT333_008745 [Trichoderma virens FT-333]|nr:hypothetical protein TrVFT333_008745 [Trichoderma virens FT-333]
MTSKSLCHHDYKIGWICALSKEQTAAIAMLDEEHPALPKLPNDNNVYTLGSISGHNIVIACLPEGIIGTNSAANVATQMVNTFPSVRFGLLVGIGAASRPESVVQWDFGKAEQGGQILRTGFLAQPPTALLTALTKLKSRHELRDHKINQFLKDMATKYPNLKSKYTWSARLKDTHTTDIQPRTTDDSLASQKIRQPGEISIHYGLIASGNQVIKDSDTRDRINKSLDGQVLCVEMEAAGLMNSFSCLVIRGICDYADSQKKKHWQKYAAAIAAAFAKELLEEVQPTDIEVENPMIDLLEQIQENSLDIQDSVIHIKSRLDKEADNEILEWLTAVDHSLQHAEYSRKRQPGTGEWLLITTEFQGLMLGKKKTLVCRGIPGAGKTILASLAIHHLHTEFENNQSVGIAYIYCDYKQQGDQDIEGLLASLLKQLLRSQTCLPQSITELFARHQEENTRPSHDELFENLECVVQLFKTAFLIIDAMDECQLSSLKQLLSRLFNLQERHDIRIFATSRPVLEIMNEFPKDEKISILDVRANPRDVLAFLEGQICSFPTVVKSDSLLQKDIKKGISEAVDGM